MMVGWLFHRVIWQIIQREVGEKKDGNNVDNDDRKRNTEEEGGHSFICFIQSSFDRLLMII